MTKSDFRTWLIYIKPFIKINYFCKQLGINQSQVAMFMKGSDFDYQISIDNLYRLYNLINDTLKIT